MELFHLKGPAGLVAMKKTDLEKLKGLRIANQIRQSPHGAGSTEPDRRERRRRDQALGLIPFAVKLDGKLVQALRSLAQERGEELNALVDELLRKGLGDSQE